MLADCHIHMVLDGSDWRTAIQRHRCAPDEAVIRQVLADYQAHGYAYLRDGGDRWGVSALARALSPEYGITYRTPLTPIYKQGHYGSFLGTAYDSLSHYAAMVKEVRTQGGDFIKLMLTGIMDFYHFGQLSEPGLPSGEIRELIHIAHEEGMAVMAHANGARVTEAAASAGADSIEHGAYLDPAALAAMEENGTVWVPTLSAIANLQGTGRFPDGVIREIVESALTNLECFKGYVAPGSDAGAFSVTHSRNTERPLLALAGIDQHRLTEGLRQVMARF